MLTDTFTMSKPSLRSHTNLQFAQANAQTKNCKRVCLPNHTDTAPLDRQTTTEKEGRTHNSTYPKGGVSWFADTFVVTESSVLRMKFGGENPALREPANS